MSCQEMPTGHIAFEVVRDIPAGDELVLDIGQIGTKHAQRTIVDGGGPNSIIIRAISKLMSGKTSTAHALLFLTNPSWAHSDLK